MDIQLTFQAAASQEAFDKAQILVESINFAHDLVNTSAATFAPGEIARYAATMASQFGLECETIDHVKIAEIGMDGFLAVSQGGAEPPRFVILRYRGAPNISSYAVTFIGKRTVFHSNDASLTYAEEMRDVAAILGAMQAIARLKFAINVTALLFLYEPLPSNAASPMSNPVHQPDGNIIDGAYADNEGCLILIDALSYANRKRLSPIIYLGPFARGMEVTQGETIGRLFCNDKFLSAELLSAGHQVGERFWLLAGEDEEATGIEQANLRQEGDKATGADTLLEVLKRFAGEIRWAHLDIASTCDGEEESVDQQVRTIGAVVRTLVELAQRLSFARKHPEENQNKSEVARLLKQIDLEFEATQLGMVGLAEGTARHKFLQRKIERVGAYKDQLTEYIGADKASRLVYEHYIQIIE